MATYLLRPNAAGDLTEMTASPSGVNHARVSDQDDLTGVTASLPNKRDLYHLEDLPASVTSVSKVTVYIRPFTEIGTGTIRASYKEGGVLVDSIDLIISEVPTTYSFEIDPPSGGGWTPVKVNGLQIGAFVPSLPPGQIYAGIMWNVEMWAEVEGLEGGTVFGAAKRTNADVVSATVQIPPMKEQGAAVATLETTSAKVPI